MNFYGNSQNPVIASGFEKIAKQSITHEVRFSKNPRPFISRKKREFSLKFTKTSHKFKAKNKAKIYHKTKFPLKHSNAEIRFKNSLREFLFKANGVCLVRLGDLLFLAKLF